MINFYAYCAGVSNSDSEIVRSWIIDASNYEVHCDSSTSTSTSSARAATTNKRTCLSKRIDCSCENNSSIPFQSTENTCTVYCDSVSSCDNSIIAGSGCANTIIFAPSTDTSIINMTLYKINSKQITIKTSLSSFINSTIIIHPNTDKIEIDSKIFANNNVTSLEAQKATTIRANKHNQKIQTISTSKATLKTDDFLIQLLASTMVVNNTINVNPKSVLININDKHKLGNDILFENNVLYSKSGRVFTKVR